MKAIKDNFISFLMMGALAWYAYIKVFHVTVSSDVMLRVNVALAIVYYSFCVIVGLAFFGLMLKDTRKECIKTALDDEKFIPNSAFVKAASKGTIQICLVIAASPPMWLYVPMIVYMIFNLAIMLVMIGFIEDKHYIKEHFPEYLEKQEAMKQKKVQAEQPML